MAEFDPQGPSDESKHNQAAQNESCCGGHSCGGERDRFASDSDSFISDWSGAETRLEAQAAAFEASHVEPRKPEQFWVDLVASQQPEPGQTTSTALAKTTDSAAGGTSETFWGELVASQRGPNALWDDLVRSQQPSESEVSSASQEETVRFVSTAKPGGMGWAEDEADEWAPPERAFEPVQPAGEPVESDANVRRDDVEWGAPASAEQDWATARSEGLAYEPTGEERPSLMAAAVEAAQQQTKAKKARKPAAKKTVAKQAKAKKPAAKAKKPAVKKAVAKRPTAKKVVKKAAPAPKITKAPTRRAA
jgi:hypothetical protein